MDLHTSQWLSLSPLPAWAWWAVGLSLLTSLAFHYVGLRREPSKPKRRLLLALRWLAVAMLLLLLLEPGRRSMRFAHPPGRMAVLVDLTASMQLPTHPGGPTRAAEAAKAVRRIWAEASAHGEEVALFGFGEGLTPLTPDALEAQLPQAEHTDLLSALKALQQATQGGKPLTGVLLVSDGADNTRLKHGINAQAEALVQSLQVPISTLLVGEEQLVDLAIERIRADSFAFVRSTLNIDVGLRLRGLAGKKFGVALKREGQVVAREEIEATQDDALHTLSFELSPERTGHFVYTVSADIAPEEVLTDNNARSFGLKVMRDRIRVLLLAGRPSWEGRFLRGLLKEDANVELVSFYILRNQADATEVSDEGRELSLIPFPMREIFEEQLSSFDVVIFQNFGYMEPQLRVSLYEGHLEKYLLKGGAFWLMGGDLSFGESAQGFQELARALPLEAAGRARAHTFHPLPTAAGLRHPSTALGKTPEETKRTWAQLPALQGLNPTRAKPTATVLLEHVAGGEKLPVFALGEYGRGRVAALTVDSTWHWAFGAQSTGTPSGHYARFFKNTLRWLTREPELTPLQIATDAPRFAPGKAVGATVRTRTTDYDAAPHTRVRVELLSTENQEPLEVRELETDSEGLARVEFNGLDKGPYKLLAQHLEDTAQESQAPFFIEAFGEELSTARVSAQTLKEIAEASQGRFFHSPDFSLQALPRNPPPPIEIGRSEDEPQWSNGYFFILFLSCCVLEWALRRRFGHV